MTYSLTIYGPPRTKKNSSRLVRAGKRSVVLPSKAWSEWVRRAEIVPGPPRVLMNGNACVFGYALEAEFNCRAIFYRDALRGDAVGFYQGLADFLEKRRVIVDDKQIVSWDGSRLELDRANPRVEVELTEVGD